jgi:hypothetical protein
MQGWKAFFEEPIMLIAFVLLGRNLEQRAKIKATSDMTGLLSILPSKARLLINNDAKELGSTVEVPCNSLSVGDQIIVLPGVSIMGSVFLIFESIISFVVINCSLFPIVVQKLIRVVVNCFQLRFLKYSKPLSLPSCRYYVNPLIHILPLF